MRVEAGVKVRVSFVVESAHGEVLDAQWRDRGHEYVQGKGEMPAWFEQGVEGKVFGEAFEFSVERQDAYGERNTQMVQKVKAEHLPQGLKEGMVVQMEVAGGGGVPLIFHVVKIKEGLVHLDGNHPMAGHDLVCRGKVLGLSLAV